MTRAKTRRYIHAFFAAPSAKVGFVGFVALLVLAIAGPTLLGHGATTLNFAALDQGPSAAHLLGTDDLGRDLLARVLAATRLSLELAAFASAISVGVGVTLGVLSALAPRLVRMVLMRVIDGMLAFPDILIAIFIVAILAPSASTATLAVGLSGAPWFARLAATLATSVMGRDYIAAARTLGVRPRRILLRHVLPNVAEPLIVASMLAVGYSIIAISSLSFLGLGVQPPRYDWGVVLAQGLGAFYTTPLATLAPAVMIAITGIVLGWMADALGRVANPQQRLGSSDSDSDCVTRVAPVVRPADRGLQSEGPPLIDVDGLSISFPAGKSRVNAVHDIRLRVSAGERVGVVGESGSGKTVLTLGLAGIFAPSSAHESRRFEVMGIELGKLRPSLRRKALAPRIAIVFQDPMASLNPALRVRTQLTEGLRRHRRMSTRDLHAAAVANLAAVAVSAPQTRMRQYPHELSGGLRQRVVIAMGLMKSPALLVADEPTTALDVTVQALVIDVLRETANRLGAAILLVSHNIAVVAKLCDRIIVMYAGRIVEDAPVNAILDHPRHPYTRALILAVPTLSTDPARPLQTIPGQVPEPGRIVVGCPFVSRCPSRIERCSEEEPALEIVGDALVACWVADLENIGAGPES